MLKQNWIRLGYTDLCEVLAYDEIDKLKTLSIDETIEDVCQKQLDSVSDSFRRAWNAKGYVIDVRDHYIDQGYRQYILCLARYFICTRFPGSKDVFLDEPRYKLFEEAQKLLKDPYLAVSKPDYSGTELSSLDVELDDNTLTLPFQRMLPKINQYGFVRPYIKDYQLSGGLFW